MADIVQPLQTVPSEMVGVEVSHRMLIVLGISRSKSMLGDLHVFVSKPCIVPRGSWAVSQCAAVGFCLHVLGAIVATYGLCSDVVADVLSCGYDARKHYCPRSGR